MFEINTIKNYKQFADILEKKTDCSIKINIVDKCGKHIHYQLNDKYGMSLGVLCIDNGDVSFAPFVTHETAQNDQYINMRYMVQFDDFIKILGIFKEMFVVDENMV